VSFLSELKRRNVFRAAAAYVAVAWLVMQVAEISFPAFGLGDRALRLLILALAIGFVPAVTLAWVFELTPEGVKRDRDLDRSGPLVARTNRLLDRAIVVLLGLGVTYFAVDKFFLSPAREQVRVEQALEQGRSEALEKQLGETSIVVLPFTNLSTDPEQAFFADGMAEELLNLLARIPELRVISRTSAFSFKDKSLSVGEIADRLKVSHVLEGSVRRSDDRIRITAQLIDAKTDSHLWSEACRPAGLPAVHAGTATAGRPGRAGSH
jgi:adenylate cyclase